MNALRSTVRLTSRHLNQKVQKRHASGAAPQWTGIDKVIRDRFPEDWQVSGLVLGGYATLITIALLKPSGAVEEPVVVAAKPAADTTGAMPSIDDAEFAEFIEDEANLNKWIDSAE
eukprot:CAMPEP_0197736820 /NCGR_PEP_ID=MMETSP1435-20131217/4399_1 /TAXON_ID=426625 /ORGANISM="Chaetoceros brevis, Strain CCMP164" /LENGTH=115 /DNA_ID=CAMNT_0043325081 /DNA_START=8 /DNA_END=355 /DNA_ORIENTATION=-